MLKRMLASLILILLPGTLYADTWVPVGGRSGQAQGAPLVEVVDADVNRTVVEVRVRGVYTAPVTLEGGPYTAVSLRAGHVSTPGQPQAPFVSRLIAIPRGAVPVLEVHGTSPMIIKDVILPPVQPKPKRCSDGGKAPFTCDQSIYRGTAVYPGPLAVIEEAGTFRDLRYVRVRFNPVQFDPAARQVAVYPGLRVKIRHPGSTFLKHKALSPTYHSLYDQHMMNYAAVQTRDGALPAVERILVITPDKFLAGVTDLVAWKSQMGFRVAVATLGEIGSTKAAIQTYLQGQYNDPETRPTYVILVGDIADMPTNSGTGGCASDFIYSQLDGNDLVSDVIISRLSVTTGAQLDLQVAKIVAYESETPVGSASQWLSGASLISSSEGSGGSNDDYRSDIIADYLTPYGYEPVDKFYNSQGNDTASNISASINSGRGFVNYLGHGSGTSWATTNPNYAISHIDALSNVDKLVTVMDVSCTNGAFDEHGTCFAEAWMRANQGGKPTGAVAIYSASTPAAWDEPAEMAVGVAKAFTQEGVHRWGDLCFSGRAYMMDVMGTGSTVKETCEQYVVFGDGSLMMRSKAPKALDVQGPSVLPVGEVEETFLVTMNGSPVKDALVHLYREGDVDLAGYTDGSGEVTLLIETQSPGELALTATAFDAFPYTGTVDVTVTGCGILKAAPGIIPCDGSIDVTLWDQDLNVDPGAPDTATLTVTSSTGGTATVLTTETEASSNQFKGTFKPSLSGMALNHGTVLTVTYQDAQCEDGAVSVAAQVEADCQAPTISDVMVLDVFATSARITWKTNEPAYSGVLLGVGSPISPFPADGLGTTHEVQLSDLTPSTTYSYLVEAGDVAGNMAYTDGPGTFTTSDCDPLCDGKECGPDGCGNLCGICSESEWCASGKCLPDGCGGDPGFTCLNACGDMGVGWCYCDEQCVAYGDCCPDYQACCLDCTADCTNKVCGDDGCNGSCGACDPGLTCVNGECLCVPDCAGKKCGDDGCGGSCGSCHYGKTCVNGVCTCVPDCEDLECGDDGCGGSCGECEPDWACVDHVCVDDCVPDCTDMECGDDGCGGSCGACGVGCTCSAQGQCLGTCDCVPDCTEMECGDDGCGGACGKCPQGMVCQDGQCLHEDIPDCTGKVCGPDGLGGSCGTCPQGQDCSADGTECLCEPDCLGRECGDNGCGGSCGLCPIGKSCLWNGKCVTSGPGDDVIGADGWESDVGVDSGGRSSGSDCAAGGNPSPTAAMLLLSLLGLLYLKRRTSGAG